MLRIEKRTDSKPAYVSIRENTRLLTPLFKQALCIAVCLHLFAFILFHVQPFRIKHANTQYPPVQVNIEIALPDSVIFSDLEAQTLHQTRIPEPAWAEPHIPYLSLNTPNHVDMFPSEFFFPKDPFNLDHHEERVASWINLNPFIPTKKKTPYLNILGPLAQRSIIIETLPKPDTSPKKSPQKRLLYTVKVDNDTGKIFWYASQSDRVDEKVAKKAETILEKIQFEPDLNSFVTQGEIELYLSGGKK